MEDRARFEHSKQIILGVFGIISTILTFEIVRQWDNIVWTSIPLAVSAVVLFLDKLEFLELMHPDGKGYTFKLLLFDFADVSLYALGLSVLIDKPTDAAARSSVFFLIFAVMFALFILRVRCARGAWCKLNLGSLVGFVVSLLMGVLFSMKWVPPSCLKLVAPLVLGGVVIYLWIAERFGRRALLG